MLLMILNLLGKEEVARGLSREELRGKSQRQRVGRMYLQNKVQTLKDLYDKNNKKYTDELNRLEYLPIQTSSGTKLPLLNR